MISIQDISFGYRPNTNVLKDFSLDFHEGRVYGLLGKNGTGKSTLLYLVAGLLKPKGGKITVDGFDPFHRDPEMLSDMFIVPEEYDLPKVTLRSYVDSLKPFYPRFDVDLLDRMLDAFGMTGDIDLGSLSMGQKKKVYICIALASNTRYLFMDEPTNGLDILSKSQFRRVVVQGMSDRRTIVISTHQVHDVERLLDYVVIIDRNKVLMDQPLSEDKEQTDLEQLFIDVVEKTRK